MMAAAKGHTDILRFLLEKSQMGQKIDLVSRTNKKGWTALFFAAAWNHLECCALLISFGANCKTKDAEKLTADNVWGSLVDSPLNHEQKFNRRNEFRRAEQAHADLLAKREEAWSQKKSFVTFLSGYRLVGPRKLSFESLFKTRRQKAALHSLRVFCSDDLMRLITKFL